MPTRVRDSRRFLRFSLRSLLALVTLAAVLTWGLRQFVIAHRERREFLAAAAKLGARVTIQPWRSAGAVAWTDASELGMLDQLVEAILAASASANSTQVSRPSASMGLRARFRTRTTRT